MRIRSSLWPRFGLLFAFLGGCADTSSEVGAVPIELGQDLRIESVTIEGTLGGSTLPAASPNELAFFAADPSDDLWFSAGTDVLFALRLSEPFRLSTRDLRRAETLHADCTAGTCPVVDVASHDVDGGAATSIVAVDLELVPGAGDHASMRLDVTRSNGDHVTVRAALPHDARGSLLRAR